MPYDQIDSQHDLDDGMLNPIRVHKYRGLLHCMDDDGNDCSQRPLPNIMISYYPRIQRNIIDNNVVGAKWFLRNRGVQVVLPAETSNSAIALMQRVDEIKAHFEPGRTNGGPFIIDPWRNIIVPICDGTTYFGGKFLDDLEFYDQDGKYFDDSPSNLNPGDRWKGALVGAQYSVSANQKYINARGGKRIEIGNYAHFTKNLINGSGRFYVDYNGKAFATKSNSTEEQPWKWVYLGDINTNDGSWFDDPSMDLYDPGDIE